MPFFVFDIGWFQDVGLIIDIQFRYQTEKLDKIWYENDEYYLLDFGNWKHKGLSFTYFETLKHVGLGVHCYFVQFEKAFWSLYRLPGEGYMICSNHFPL